MLMVVLFPRHASKYMINNTSLQPFYHRIGIVGANGILIIAIFLFLYFLHYPLLLNADYLLGWEEARLINTVLDMARGGPVYFYHEGASYQGILDNLIALPFFYFFGTNTLALKLSGLMCFSLYLWSCFYLTFLIKREAVWIAMILLLFPPTSILLINYNSAAYSLICFFGNIIFILFSRAQSSSAVNLPVIFFLFFTVGLAIYSYTYSILYIAAIFILYLLTQPQWEEMRSKFSSVKLKQWARTKWPPREKFTFLFDSILAVFIFVVLFSYVFGGFGIDIGGVSIFQVNNLHKPLGQLVVLVILRLLIFGKDSGVFLKKFREVVTSFDENSRRLFAVGVVGFIIGFFPRLASIAGGETKRGGQGFDIDIIPTKILEHSWDFIATSLPQTLGLFQPIDRLFSSFSQENIVTGLLALMGILPLYVIATWCFYASNWETVKKIIRFRKMEFEPSAVLVLFPALTCLANIVTMNGPLERYLFPLSAIFGIWSALVLCRIKRKSFFLFVSILFIWVGFYSVNTYQYYSKQNLIKGLGTVVKREPMLDVIDFVNSMKITTVYSSFSLVHKARFLSQGKPEFYSCIAPQAHQKARDRFRGSCKWHILGEGTPPVKNIEPFNFKADGFAVLVASGKEEGAVRNFMSKNKISFQGESIGTYTIFWDFIGSAEKIDKIPVVAGI